MDTLVFAYYCSGHGYGHATRVSAFARHLLSLTLDRRLTIHIVSSAPRHVFADSIACGALYRPADIDPVIVQPLAYRVDRQKSVQVLEDFLARKDAMLDRERRWLIDSGVNCVLSDAAFLGCLAAKSAGIPSILITNFTFDSVYSYLATSLVDAPSQLHITPSNSTLSPSSSTATDASLSSSTSEQLLPDVPISESVLAPLVSQLHEGYQHADLLLRLPGHIPIPSFFDQPALPSSQWVDPTLNQFHSSVTKRLLSPLDTEPLRNPKPFPNSTITIPRSARAAPLLVRPPSPGIYTPEGRATFLRKNGLPDFEGMKVLVVSFGGQVFKRPGGSKTNSRIQSRFPSQEALVPSRSGGPTTIDSDTSNQTQFRKSQSKRSSKDYQGFHKTSTSLDRLALKARDLNAGAAQEQAVQLDLDAVNKGLRTHIKSRSSEGSKQTTRRISEYSDENTSDYTSSDVDNASIGQQESDQEPLAFFNETNTTAQRRHTLPRRKHNSHDMSAHRRLATPSHILIPGAPPASKPLNTLLRTPSLGKGLTKGEHEGGKLPEMCVIPPTPKPSAFPDALSTTIHNFRKRNFLEYENSNPLDLSSPLEIQSPDQGVEDSGVGLLPDENWIAVICGVSKEQWNEENEEGGLPEGFYVAPRDVYMPDLIAVGDVVLGKLGYGMTSECVDACTPFVYVSRPLFIEEHGLRMYLDQEGVGVELSRAGYENGEWARSVEEAYCKGWEMKQLKRKKGFEFCRQLKQLDKEGADGSDEKRLSERERQGREMARDVIEWVDGVRNALGGKSVQNVICMDGAGSVDFCERPVAPIETGAKGILVA